MRSCHVFVLCSFADCNLVRFEDGVVRRFEDFGGNGDIHEEVESHNQLLDRVGNKMDASRGMMMGTMDRFKKALSATPQRRTTFVSLPLKGDSMVITSMANALKDPLAASEASSSSIVDERMTVEIQKKQRTTAWPIGGGVGSVGVAVLTEKEEGMTPVLPKEEERQLTSFWFEAAAADADRRRRH
ncbi:Bet1-like SNARE 1-2 [Vigna angularis]|uniref:Bet1-like SNARE 1-2 n=1 Tax=Phaseolus angularis TaxID=3914 RepID=A0A8T0L0V7_PHAAN|nr:Bet1-like SNARE 1-2 [Vigna angularis]